MTSGRKRKRSSTESRPSPPKSAARAQHPRRRWLIALVVIGAAGLGIAGYRFLASGSGRPIPAAIDLPHGAAAGFNVVLVTLDTLRSDHVGCYGYTGGQTPTLDALAKGGVRFVEAVTVVPMTLPAHTSILTGQYPPVHGVRDNGTYRLVGEHETIAERLQGQGYATAAFIGAFVLDGRYGLNQGFDVYDDRIMPEQGSGGVEALNPQRRGDVVVNSAISWVEEHQRAKPDQRFFAWVHLFDPHAPYDPPEPFRTQYAAKPYDGEVAFVDQQVGRFVDKLRELKLIDKTIMVLVGDHGEGLGDHGESTHSLLVYEATVKIPLILYAPAIIPAGRVIDDRVVAIVDVMPTILDMAGLEPSKCDGMSLLGPADSDRAVYIETLATSLNHGWAPLHALRRHHDKYIEAPTSEYYDLTVDPGEQRNLASANSKAERLSGRLAALMKSFPAGSGASVTPDQEAMAKLRALGYIGGNQAAAAGPSPDPKDMVAQLDRMLTRANALISEDRNREAIPLLENLLKETPGDASLWSLLSMAQARTSLVEDAIASRLRAIELQGNDPGAWLALASLQYAKGDIEAWRTSLAQAEQLEPESGEVFLVRARHALYTGQLAEALAMCSEARRRDPTRCAAKSWSLEGAIQEQSGQPAEAEAAYARACQMDSSEGAALLGLARLAERRGQFEQVVEYAGRIRRGRPEWAASRTLLATAHLQLGQGESAIRVMTEWVEAAPNQPEVHNNLGGVYHRLGRLTEAAECYRRAIALDPGYAKARENLARIEQPNGQQ
jgi:choline-sulfatase